MSGVAIVTGASRGIGLAIARALGERGLRVAMLAHDEPKLRASADELGAVGIEAQPIVCDVTVADDVARACRWVHDAWGPATVAVANAGIVRRAPVHELAIADFDAQIAVNLRGAFLLAHHVVGPMRGAKRGRFVAIASISATLGTANASAYNASKWGLVGFTKSLAEELVGTGVQAVAVNPGSVDTDMLVGSPYPARMTASDVAGLVRYAALDAPDAINGAALDIFGG